MLRCNDETTDHDALHFAIEREWKRDSVQYNFWRCDGWCKFYVPVVRYVSSVIGPAEIPDDISPMPVAFAQLIRTEGVVYIATPLDPSYRWFIPLRFDAGRMIRTPLINPANRK